MRRSLLLPAFLCLTGCDVLVRQQIVQAQLRVPHAPSPILPMDTAQRISLDGGLSGTVSQLPLGGIIDDSSGSRVGTGSPPVDGSLRFCFHYKELLVGEEIGDGRATAFAGVNVQSGPLQFLGWGGLSLISWHQDVLYKQGWSTDTTNAVAYWNTSRDSGTETSGAISLGVAVQSGQGIVRPFAAARLDLGPTIDGTNWLSDSPAAENSINLSQLQLDGGLRVDCAPWAHAYAGAGSRVFLSSFIRGNDWRVFGGVAVDLWRTEPR
jgi:hypothetical protein